MKMDLMHLEKVGMLFFFYSKKGLMQTVPVLYSLPWKASGFTGIQEHHIFPYITLVNGHEQDPFLTLSMY